MADDQIGGNVYQQLAKRFFITILLGIVVYRLGIYVPIPGVDSDALAEFIGDSGVFAYANMFNGGAIANASIFGLGIMPYISASIIMQLMSFSFPALKALKKEGEVGRRKINQYTRYATMAICAAQALFAAIALQKIGHDGGSPIVPEPGASFVAMSVLVITTGSMVLLWLAEQITRFGVGNGVSVIIMIGILASFPGALENIFNSDNGGADLPKFLLLAVVFFVIIASMVMITLARRNINLEQQRRVQGNRVYGGQQTQLPLMLNHAGVIPVIFASPLIMIAVWALGLMGLGAMFAAGEPAYRLLFAAMIIFFTFFYISITVDLNEWANHFKQAGFFIRGIKPGRNTVDHLRARLMRITFVGALSLAAIAIVPQMLGEALEFNGLVTQAILGGVGLLIVVGVSLDVIQKVSAFLLANQYQGMMGADAKPSRGKGRGGQASGALLGGATGRGNSGGKRF